MSWSASIQRDFEIMRILSIMMNEYTSNKLDEYISNVNQTVEQILVMHSLDQAAHIHGWHEK